MQSAGVCSDTVDFQRSLWCVWWAEDIDLDRSAIGALLVLEDNVVDSRIGLLGSWGRDDHLVRGNLHLEVVVRKNDWLTVLGDKQKNNHYSEFE